MTTREETTNVWVTAKFELGFRLPPGVGSLTLERHRGFEAADQYTLQVVVMEDSVEGAETALRELREQLVEALTTGELP